jgi:uncharacterized DUF497 family protein
MFEWDDANVYHLEPHRVTPDEVEQAFADPDALRIHAHRGPRGERRRGIIGTTEVGRLLTVFYTNRNGLIRVVTARDADDDEADQYNRHNR